ncbi:MAG TPA: 50S ribosomal protein L11 methyltransferase [Candidatus Limnocylindrales bacterium]
MARIIAETLDELHLTQVPLVPEIRLHLAQDAIIFWARLEAEAKTHVPAPFWASAWAGGQALARYVLDHPWVVRGKRVLDVASGSGLAAIAAALAGAAEVTANDIDPKAVAAIRRNAAANHVPVAALPGDILGLDTEINSFDVILMGDGLYDSEVAEAMLRFLRRQIDAHGADVLVGDPGRGHLPQGELRRLATYPLKEMSLADSVIKSAAVFRLAAGSAGSAGQGRKDRYSGRVD